ncbi:zinc finger protein [Anaeramoeba flamelloides]|uniref:Zinc finger protein n=1 Tax=Anaeramoeba flamelloides TaxID=1746091 RepID=A0ABQ8X5E2_9EUKA|nr:zinc finger protein [Anaeramoeba flamelloides]
MSTYKSACNGCRLYFPSREELMKHYKTEFHQFNLIRKSQQLIPLTNEQYDQYLEEQMEYEKNQKKTRGRVKGRKAQRRRREKIRREQELTNIVQGISGNKKQRRPSPRKNQNLQQTNKQTNEKENKSVKETVNKQTNENTKEKETKEKEENQTKIQETTNEKEQEQEQEQKTTQNKMTQEEYEENRLKEKLKRNLSQQVGVNTCAFCGKECGSVKKTLSHMSKVHCFYIPDLDFLTDPEGLVTYINDKISLGNFCCYCDKEFKSLVAVRDHMISAGHTRIKTSQDNWEEFADYYDYSSSYTQEGIDLLVNELFPNEEIITEEMEETVQETMVSVRFFPKPVVDPITKELLIDGGTRRLGNREFKHIYKQKIDYEKVEKMKQLLEKKYLALGWVGSDYTWEEAKKMRKKLNVQSKRQVKEISQRSEGFNSLRRLYNLPTKH